MIILLISLNCVCENLTFFQALGKADMVFEGILIKSDTSLTFKVINPIKQVNDTILVIYNDNECPYSFEFNKLYRVFAKRKENKLITSKCFNNEKLEDYEEIRDYSE
jgi:deoxyxylulose-5-phosphate synthase